MIKLILFAVMLCGGSSLLYDCVMPADGQTPPVKEHKSARILELEKKFSIQFMGAKEGVFDSGMDYKIWTFTAVTPMRIGIIGFCTPEGASDKEVRMCLAAAEFCSGWEGQWYESRSEHPEPSVSPSPSPAAEITHT